MGKALSWLLTGAGIALIMLTLFPAVMSVIFWILVFVGLAAIVRKLVPVGFTSDPGQSTQNTPGEHNG